MGKFIIGDTPAQLGQIEAAHAMMIDGKVVKRDDYRALAAQVEALKQSNASLHELCDEIIDHLRYNKAERSEVLDDFWSKLSAIGCAESPAACLAQVRAEAVMEAANECNKYSGDFCAHSDLLKHAERIRQGGTK